jgi:hypothetical protein
VFLRVFEPENDVYKGFMVFYGVFFSVLWRKMVCLRCFVPKIGILVEESIKNEAKMFFLGGKSVKNEPRIEKKIKTSSDFRCEKLKSWPHQKTIGNIDGRKFQYKMASKLH